jgi:hypothetical protein
MLCGLRGTLIQRLKAAGLSGRLNTAFIERLNLTVRQGVALLARRTWGTAQFTSELAWQVEWRRGYYHFVRYHEARRVERAVCRKRKGWPSISRYRSQPPAMAAGIASRRWSVLELIRTPMD